jgi:hypothetical protein
LRSIGVTSPKSILPNQFKWLRKVSISDCCVLVAFTVALVALSLAPRVFGHGVDGAFDRSLGLNAGEVLSLLAIISLARRSDLPIKLESSDLFVLAVCSLFFVPAAPQSLPVVGASLAGLWLNYRRSNVHLRSIGKLWLALSASEAWGKLVFKLLGAPVLRAEAAVAAKAGRFFGLDLYSQGVEIRGAENQSVYLLDACSCFHNLTLTTLIWYSLLVLSHKRVDVSMFLTLMFAMVLVVILNTTRILLMTRSEVSYQFWHFGGGEIIFSSFGLILSAVPVLVMTRSRL